MFWLGTGVSTNPTPRTLDKGVTEHLYIPCTLLENPFTSGFALTFMIIKVCTSHILNILAMKKAKIREINAVLQMIFQLDLRKSVYVNA